MPVIISWLYAFWVNASFVLRFSRDPYWAIPQDEGVIIFSADGNVIVTGLVDDPCRGRKAFN